MLTRSVLSFLALLLFVTVLFAPVEAASDILIPNDQIGVAITDHTNADEMASLMKQLYGFDLVGQPSETMLLFNINNQLPYEELVKLGRQIEEENPSAIGHAGLLAYPIKDDKPIDTPMIMTSRLIVQFYPEVDQNQIDDMNASFGTSIIYENPYQKQQFLLTLDPGSPSTAIEIAELYEKEEMVEFAHPDYVQVLETRETILNDTLFGNQWHHRNTGQAAGTPDADIDASWAWDMTQGNANIIIAVLDGGFDMGHPDLTPNLFTNGAEVLNGADDDGNRYVDDRTGWDFTNCSAAAPAPGCGDNNPTGPDTNAGRHGTAVAGTAAARGGNNLGVTGSCPTCSYLPIRIPLSSAAASVQALAFGYAQAMGAHIMTNSWGYVIGTPATAAVVNAINNAANNGRGGLGSIVLFAMNNPNVNDCIAASLDISSIPNVIAVSRASNRDQFDFSGFGNCMDLLAPSAGLNTVGSGRGTLWATTTDMQGNAGYNNNAASASCPSAAPANRDYTNCFNGTSFATPLTAGVVGLILSEDNSLTRLQVQRLLQDTADKVEHSTGAYSPTTGFSTPAGGIATHGYGRVNAFEAVRVVSDDAALGRDGVDIFLRDNNLDWGNTMGYQDGVNSGTTFEPTRGRQAHWVSPDIKVDAWPFATAPTTSQQFDAFVNENPEAGEINRVYVRVHNRGSQVAANVTVKLHWTHFGTALPALPGDFWTAFPADSVDTSQVHPIGVNSLTNLGYSGASVAGTAADGSQITTFSWNVPNLTPGTPNHYCLFAVIDSAQDPIDANSEARFAIDSITPNDNNVTHRNVQLVDSRSSRFYDLLIFIRNPFTEDLLMRLDLDDPDLQQYGWVIDSPDVVLFEEFTMKGGEERLIKIIIEAPDEGMSADIGLTQYALMEVDDKEGRALEWTPVGGAVFSVTTLPEAIPTAVTLSQSGASTSLHVALPLALLGLMLGTLRIRRRRIQ